MAKIDFTPGIDRAQGALSKGGLITRQKIYRDKRGRVIAYGKQEGYYIANPRNFKRHPMVGKELEYHNFWREVCAQTKEELTNPATRGQWELRFEAQLWNNQGSQPDPDAPVNPATGAPKRYSQLYAFVRAMIYQRKKTERQ